MAMSRLARFNLLAAFRDLAGFLRMRERHHWIAGLAALLVTGWVVYALAQDSYMERAPEVVYVNSWPTTRSDAEIKREITAASEARHKAEAERRREFQKLADQFGIDTTPRK